MRFYLIVLLGLLFSNQASAYDMVAYNNGVEVTLTNILCPTGSNGGVIKLAYVKSIEDESVGKTCFFMEDGDVVIYVPGTTNFLTVPGKYFHRK